MQSQIDYYYMWSVEQLQQKYRSLQADYKCTEKLLEHQRGELEIIMCQISKKMGWGVGDKTD